MKYFKDFNEWNRFKKILEQIYIPLYGHEGEVWCAATGMNLGSEIDGKGDDFQRPVLVIKRFNNQQCWVVPISSKKKHLIPNLQIKIHHFALHQESILILNQLSLLSNKRLLYRIGRIDPKQFKGIIHALIQLFPT